MPVANKGLHELGRVVSQVLLARRWEADAAGDGALCGHVRRVLLTRARLTPPSTFDVLVGAYGRANATARGARLQHMRGVLLTLAGLGPLDTVGHRVAAIELTRATAVRTQCLQTGTVLAVALSIGRPRTNRSSRPGTRGSSRPSTAGSVVHMLPPIPGMTKEYKRAMKRESAW